MPDRNSRRPPSTTAADASSLFEPRRSSLAGSLFRVVVQRPADSIGALVAAALGAAILVNALLLQTGPHPAPLLAPAALPAPAKDTTGSLAAFPRPRPAEAQAADKSLSDAKRARVQLLTDIQRELARRDFYEGPIDGVFGSRMDASIREFEQAAGLRSSGEPSENILKALVGSPLKADRTKAQATARRADAPAAAAAPSRRVAAAQRALTEFGYGQLKLTGVLDEPTKAAIEKFERERKLPVKGQLSDRLLRELSSATGRPFE